MKAIGRALDAVAPEDARGWLGTVATRYGIDTSRAAVGTAKRKEGVLDHHPTPHQKESYAALAVSHQFHS